MSVAQQGINYRTIKFAYKPSLMFQADLREQWIFGREPILCRMRDGTLISTVLSGGPTEPHCENRTLIIRSEDDGKIWSNPAPMFIHSERATWVTEIFNCPDGKAMAMVHTYDGSSGHAEIRAFFSESIDFGKNWSEPKSIHGTPPNFSVRQGITMSNGELLFPVYWTEQSGSFDWKYNRGLPAIDYTKYHTYSGVIISSSTEQIFTLYACLSGWEPAVIEVEPGHLKMYIRKDETGVLFKAESFDYGRSWKEYGPSEIPNSGCKVSLFKINNTILLAHNPTAEGRDILELWTSKDGLKSFEKKIRLAEIINREPETGEFSTGGLWHAICYPHGFPDFESKNLYLACDSGQNHFLQKIPFSDIL